MTKFFKINKYLTLIIFFFSLICLAFSGQKIDLDFANLICLFLILTIGVSHGSLDHLKGYKILKIYKIQYKFLFYLIYILISLMVILFWIFFPFIVLSFFLFIASYHFGKEDSSFLEVRKQNFTNFYFFLKGSLVVLAPLWANPEETVKIFEILNVELKFFNNDIIFSFIGISILSNLFISKNAIFGLLDSFSIIVLNVVFSPLVAFTLYFCFLHSIRHTLSLVEEIDGKNFTSGVGSFIKKALPLTLMTAIIFVASVYILKNYYILDDAILKVIFIGLASLTFPHILLEYIIEKNEK